ncbi:MAG: efflux RND transporter periplasmic adaptor subunit [Gammaproteobacteria bacterium]|nr:efflux RND transporter periplasmic adaptor subunit [Gammaproteobacteria bacterium]
MTVFKKHPILIVSLLIVLTLAGLFIKTWLASRSGQSGYGYGGVPQVITQPAIIMTLVDEIEAIGTTLANESVNLTAKVTDTVRKVNFEDGDYVEAGAILVEMTDAEETAQVAEAQAALNEAQRQLKRIENLIRQRMASELQLDEQKARQQTAEARLNAIIAKLDDRLIRAPFAGILGFRNVSTGTLLSPNTVVTTLDDISIIKVDFSVPERYLSAIQPGQEIQASSASWAQQEFVGEVKTINSRVDPITRSVTVRAHITNENRLLKPGMLLTIKLIRSRDEALVIPEESVVPISDQQYVYIVGEDGIVQQLAIKVGRRQPGIVEVLSGLQAGQEVVTQGVIKIRPGIKVLVKRQEPDPDAAI